MEHFDTASKLSSADEVIDALGGTVAVARLSGRSKQAVSSWRSNKRLPSNSYLLLSAALRERNLSAPAALWNMTEN
jgi:hypothetical protein